MELHDEYGVLLKEGQAVAVAINARIVLKGTITSIVSDSRMVEVLVHWPAGNDESRYCTHYGYRSEEGFCMSEIVVIE